MELLPTLLPPGKFALPTVRVELLLASTLALPQLSLPFFTSCLRCQNPAVLLPPLSNTKSPNPSLPGCSRTQPWKPSRSS